jgi:hypothetical protein
MGGSPTRNLKLGRTLAIVVDIGVLWGAGGVLVGFQVTALTLRVNREIEVGGTGDFTWLPVADCINLLSLSLTLIGVFVLPVINVIGLGAASKIFGLAVLLLVGYAFALAGHYEMFNPTSGRSMEYFPLQERVVVALVGIATISYVVTAALR